MADSVAHKVGIFKGLCNRTACRRPNAEYYNHSTHKYYCNHCAGKLNRRNPEALDLYGHALCTHGRREDSTHAED